MQILSNGAVAIADAGAAHGWIAAGASNGCEGAPIVGAASGAISRTVAIFDPESNA